ncbi:MAG: hypothetical protein KGH69_00740 [Candidatus Micrarchaeota archaeon]|nr:hypothetical protein [Candidatus Micrarchaeota archaeon]
MKAQFMSIAVLVIFILMLAEVILLITLQVGYDKLQQSNSFTSTSNNYASLITRNANDFGKASLSSALNTLFKYEYNSTMRKGNFISSFSVYMASLMVNGTLPNVIPGSATANTIKSYMGNAMFLTYNSNLAASLGIAVTNINVTQTKPVITQFGPYTLSATYTETVRINNSGTYLTYKVPVNATIPLNNTPDLFYAQQGILRYIRFSNMSNLSSVTGNAYATNGSYSFAYGTLYKLAAGASSCPSTASNSIILFTVNAMKLNKCENNFGGLITYGGANMITETPTVPYLFYNPSSNALNSFQNGQGVLLYGPSLATYNIDNLRSNISNGYYFASPYAPSYSDRVSSVFVNQSSNGMFNFMGYNKQVSSFNSMNSNIIIPHSVGIDSSSQYTISSWVRTTNTIGMIFSAWSGSTGSYQLYLAGTGGKPGSVCVWAGGSGAYCTNTIVNDGSWHNIAAVFQSSYRGVYVDGRLVGASTLGNNISNSGNNQVGAQCSGSGCTLYAPMQIANMQVYNASLNSSQMQNIYQRGIEGLPVSNSIAGWWPLNGNANDYSGYNSSGVATNVIYTGLTNYNRDSALVRTVPGSLSPLPGVGACTSTKACLGYNVSRLYLGSSPLLIGNGQQTAAGFNRQSSYISVGNMPQIGSTTAWTVSFWMDSAVVASNDNPLDANFAPDGNNAGPRFEETAPSTLNAVVGTSPNSYTYNTISSSLLPNTWYHIVLVRNGDNLIGYFDGVQVFNYPNTLWPSGFANLMIGRGFSTSRWFNGSISNVQIYGTALSAGQTNMLYNRGIFGLPLTNTKLVGWWPLNGNANDYSGNGYNGTAYQIAWQKASTLTNSSGTRVPLPSGGLVSGSTTEWQALGLGSSYSVPSIYCIGGYNSIAAKDFNASYGAQLLSNVGTGVWRPVTPYPINVYDHACTSYNNEIYCVTGYNSGFITNTYYAPVSSTGIGAWTAGSAYPLAAEHPTCVAYNGYIYCVGGDTATGIINQIYYAPISSTGIGTWTSTTNSYPISITISQCMTANGYIYCVAGETTGGSMTSLTYYAPISSTGVGTWASTTAYPSSVGYHGCVNYNNYIYCVGGDTTGSASNGVSSTYYAPISATGIGAWNAGMSYPFTVWGHRCSTSNGYLYCVGGYASSTQDSAAVYYAPLSTTGIGPWNYSTSYPKNVETTSCSLTAT